RATNSGTFTVLIADGSVPHNQTGTYRLTLAKTGSAVTISSGDEGGPMTNGLTHTGVIDVGDLDCWTIDATAGENILIRMGELVAGSALSPYLRLYGPNGVQLDFNANTAVAEVEVRATNTGTFLLVASDGSTGFGNTGTYRLTLVKTGSPISISDGDDGGPMTNGLTHTGTIDIGDLD